MRNIQDCEFPKTLSSGVWHDKKHALYNDGLG